MNPHPPGLCPRFHKAVELIGRRWSGAVLQSLMDGPRRFGDLRSAVPEISDRMLSERLKELEAEGIVEREVSQDAPVRVRYRLTDKGRALEAPLRAIESWAHEWVPADGEGGQAVG